MRMEKCCCFTGHRPQKLPWGSNEWDWRCVALKERILLLIRELYREGYRHFITGMALGIDTYCCEMVLRLKEEHNDVVLEAALPCRDQDRNWSRKDKERYRRLVAQCDLQTLVQEEYTRGQPGGVRHGRLRRHVLRRHTGDADLCLGAAEGGQAH